MESVTIESSSSSNSPEPPQRPDHVPEKFWNAESGEVNVEAMAKSYSELERTQSTPDAPATDTPTEAPTNTELPDAVPEADTGALTDQQMGDYFTQYVENEGVLPENSYAELEKMGYTKQMVDTFIAGVNAQKDGVDSAVYEVAGGQEGFEKMLPWLVENLSAAEKSAYENAQQSLDSAKAAELMVSFKARYEAANGSPPSMTIEGKSGGGEGAYKSPQEMTKDMQDPRYRNDPAWRQMVRNKIANAGPGFLGSHQVSQQI